MRAVCFLAVSYFGSNDLINYIGSLMGQTDNRWLLKVIDNSSDENENHRLRDLALQDPRIEVWEPGKNLGYFGAAEWARCKVAENGFEWIAVTNTDVVLARWDFVERLLGLSDMTAAVIAPKIYGSKSRSELNPYMFGRPTLLRSQIRRILFWNVTIARVTVILSHMRHRMTKSRITPSSDVAIYAAHGSFMIFGTTFFAKGGNFRHTSFLFGEEITIAEYCRNEGIPTIYSPMLEVEHTEHANTGVLRSKDVLRSQVIAAKNALRLISSSR
jgi:GT2 family glycosyltransferase